MYFLNQFPRFLKSQIFADSMPILPTLPPPLELPPKSPEDPILNGPSETKTWLAFMQVRNSGKPFLASLALNNRLVVVLFSACASRRIEVVMTFMSSFYNMWKCHRFTKWSNESITQNSISISSRIFAIGQTVEGQLGKNCAKITSYGIFKKMAQLRWWEDNVIRIGTRTLLLCKVHKLQERMRYVATFLDLQQTSELLIY